MANRYKMLHQGVVVVRDEDLSQEAGRVVYWSIHGDQQVSVLREKLSGILPEHDLPPTRTPQAAFSAAVKQLASRRRLVRPLERKGGFAIVDEAEVRNDEQRPLSHDTVCTVRLVTQDDGLVRVASTPEGHPMRVAVQEEFEKQSDLLSASDLGVWLVSIAERALSGVRLRPSGGFYFIPRTSVGTWQAVSLALRDSGVETFQIPAVTSADAVKAVTSAITREAQSILDDVAADLDAGTLGARALVNRESELRGVDAKLRMYEDLLGMSLESLRSKVDEVQGNLAAAALTRMSGDVQEQPAA